MKKAKSVLVFVLMFFASVALAQNAPGKKASHKNEGLKSAKIGSQTWTTQNLNVSVFRNKDVIQQAKNIDEWKKALSEAKPAWCYYEFEESNGLIYGKFYNWYAVHDPRGLAPKGWHIPKIAEWDTLLNFVGSNQAWSKMVDTSNGWMNGISKTSNETGFSVLGGGLCGESSFGGIGMETAFWSASKDPSSLQNSSNLLAIHFGTSWAPGIGKAFGEERGGMYVRCVKD
jgi:uncharacterized protein (TIGR02145 family)